MNHRPVFILQSSKDPAEYTEVYLLRPGAHFDRFGGSKSGLTVGKTPSLIVRSVGKFGTTDTEEDFDDPEVWRKIVEAVKRGAILRNEEEA